MTAPPDIWAALPNPALIIAPGGAVTRANPAAELMFNRSERVLCQLALWDLIPSRDELAPAVARTLTSGSPVVIRDVDIALVKDISVRANLRLAPMVGGPVILCIDVVPTQSPMMADRGAKSAIGVAEMLVHEIKNPLSGISGAAQLLDMSLPPQNAEDRTLTQLIVDETRRITDLLAQLEQFGDHRLAQRAAVNLHDVLDQAKRSAEVGFARHMTFTQSFDPSLPHAMADRDQIQQVLLNLLKNAAEACPDSGTIHLHSYYDAGFRGRGDVVLPLHLEIRDNGPGLARDIADHVFDPFVSGRENGTGLGLALVSKLMTDNGGLVAVTSDGAGTRFRLSFERAPDAKGRE